MIICSVFSFFLNLTGSDCWAKARADAFHHRFCILKLWYCYLILWQLNAFPQRGVTRLDYVTLTVMIRFLSLPIVATQKYSISYRYRKNITEWLGYRLLPWIKTDFTTIWVDTDNSWKRAWCGHENRIRSEFSTTVVGHWLKTDSIALKCRSW